MQNFVATLAVFPPVFFSRKAVHHVKKSYMYFLFLLSHLLSEDHSFHYFQVMSEEVHEDKPVLFRSERDTKAISMLSIPGFGDFTSML